MCQSITFRKRSTLKGITSGRLLWFLLNDAPLALRVTFRSWRLCLIYTDKLEKQCLYYAQCCMLYVMRSKQFWTLIYKMWTNSYLNWCFGTLVVLFARCKYIFGRKRKGMRYRARTKYSNSRHLCGYIM